MVVKDESAKVMHDKYKKQTLDNIDLSVHRFQISKLLPHGKLPIVE